MKTREDIITSMCYTWNHAYGMLVDDDCVDPLTKLQGFTREQQQHLWDSMAQLYDNDIAPHVTITKK